MRTHNLWRNRAWAAILASSLAVPAVVAGLGMLPGRDGMAYATTAHGKLGVIGALRFADLHGKTWTSSDIATHKATVFFFVSTQCPISNTYTARFLQTAANFTHRDVQFFAVYANRQESLAEVTEHAKQRNLSFPVVRDVQDLLVDRLGAKMTPEAILVDATGAVRYRGRLDDNVVATRATTHELQDALEAVLTGQTVAKPEAFAIGCAIRRPAHPALALAGVPTYAREVAPILRAKCESCHRPGEVGPFSLQTYAQASAWANDIKRYTQSNAMPPWKPVNGYGEFRNQDTLQLSASEKTTLAKWAEAGAPLGNAKQVPPARAFTPGWQLGEPDMVVSPDHAYKVGADGDDVYRNFVVDPHFTEDMYVRAVEVRPGNAAVVHHVINYIDGRGDAIRLEKQNKDGQLGYTSFGGPGFMPTGFLGGWAPGNDPQFMPDGVAMKIPKGARLVIQVHYHKDGKPETDLTRIGLHFSRSSVDKLLHYSMAINFMFQIPPQAPHYEVRSAVTLQKDCHAFAITPHMHLLGREMKLWATLPDGTEKPLVWIKDWDFNWQMNYAFKEPLALPKGTKINLVAYYDNTATNPRNRNGNHNRTVTWGEQTTDEMCIAFLALTHDDEHLAVNPGPIRIQTASNTTR